MEIIKKMFLNHYMKCAIFLMMLFPAIAFSWYAPVNDNKNSSEKNEGIQFATGSWEEILAMAEKENKMVFLDIYTTWCGPCKKLKSNTFTNKNVGEFYNKNFINVSIDAEKGEGRTLARQFQITGFPTLIFVNSKGELQNKTMGYHNPKDFLKLGETVFQATR